LRINAVAFSDLHGRTLPTIDPSNTDLVLVAGDIAPGYEVGDWQYDWVKRVFIPWCKKLAPTQIVLIGGNRDYYLETTRRWPRNVHYLKDKAITLFGLKIYGTPWIERMVGRSPSMFELYPSELAKVYAKIPEDTDILLTHMPPHCPRSNLDLDEARGYYYGNDDLYKAIRRVQPKLAVCGHVHDGDHKPCKVGKTTVANVSIINSARIPINKPFRFRLTTSM